MKIHDIMRPGSFTISVTDTLGSAHRIMARSHVRHLPVLGDNKVVGMLSERDILAARAGIELDDEWWAIPVRKAMRTPVQTAVPNDTVADVAARMSLGKLGAMPIIERGKLVGIVTVTDILAAEARAANELWSSSRAIASDAMTPWPVTVRPETTMVEAITLMIERHVRHLPVVNPAGVFLGMLTERDVRTAVGDPVQYLERQPHIAEPHLVRDVMTGAPIAVQMDRPLIEVARSFADTRLDAIAVVDKVGALIGIVSYVDVLRVLAK